MDPEHHDVRANADRSTIFAAANRRGRTLFGQPIGFCLINVWTLLDFGNCPLDRGGHAMDETSDVVRCRQRGKWDIDCYTDADQDRYGRHVANLQTDKWRDHRDA